MVINATNNVSVVSISRLFVVKNETCNALVTISHSDDMSIRYYAVKFILSYLKNQIWKFLYHDFFAALIKFILYNHKQSR